MKLYTEEQVEILLKEQRSICEDTADYLEYPNQKFFTTGKMLSANQPDLELPANPILHDYEYELFFKSEPSDPCKIDGWFPIATDRIRHPERIGKYIQNGVLRKINNIPQ